MRGLSDDVRYAIRSLVRRPTFTGFAVLTVALGVGATTAIYSTLEGVVLRPVPYDRADRMVVLFRPIGNSGGMRTPDREQMEAWREMDEVFEAIEPMSSRTMTLLGEGEPVELQAGLIEPSFHDFVGRPPVLGRAFTEEEVRTGARVLLLGHGLWKRRFGGDGEVLGETLRLDGEAWTVVGVLPPRTPLLGFGIQEVDLWKPLPPDLPGQVAVGLLREGVGIDVARSRLEAPVELASGETASGVARGVAQIVATRMSDTLRVLMGAVVVLLVISCVNVSNLLLGRAGRRRHETAVRAALGGGRGRLARQVLVEGLLLGLLGGAAGLGLAWIGLETILTLRPATLDALDGVTLNGRILLFTVAVTLGASLLFSLVPAWRATRQDALQPLWSGTRDGSDQVGGSRVRWVLVSAEVALSFTLLVGAAVVLAAFAGLQREDPGFQADRVLSMKVSPPSWRFDRDNPAGPLHDLVRERVEALPGVERISLASGRPASAGVLFGTVEVEGAEPTEDTQILHGPAVDGAYFGVLGQPVLHGRSFASHDRDGDGNVGILGESTARRFFGEVDAVGRRFRIGGSDEWWTVIGVVGDVAMRGLSAEQPLQLYTPLTGQNWGATRTYLVRAAPDVDPTSLVPRVRGVVREHFPDALIADVATLEKHLAGTLARERFTSTLLSAFTALALVLAAVGLYGVISQLVGQRTREIGIRMALGADRRRIRRLVLRYGLTTTIAGIAVGAVAALVADDVLVGLLVGARESGFAEFAVAALTVSAVSLVAVWAPARRATRIDPTEAMRTE